MKSEYLPRPASLLVLLLLAVPPSAFAGAKPAAKPAPDSADVRVLPVGETPPLAMHQENGRYVQTPYRPGEAPASRMVVHEGSKAKSVTMTLNRLNRVPGGVDAGSHLRFAVPGDKAATPETPWCEATLPAGSRKVLVLLRPSPDAKWNRPLVETIDLASATTGGPGIRIINTGTLALSGRIGEENVVINPGATVSIPAAKIKGAAPFRFASQGADRNYLVEIDRTVAAQDDAVNFLIIYPSRNIPGKRVAICEFSERLPVPERERVAMDGR